jgi:flagellar biosynthesis protein FliP
MFVWAVCAGEDIDFLLTHSLKEDRRRTPHLVLEESDNVDASLSTLLSLLALWPWYLIFITAYLKIVVKLYRFCFAFCPVCARAISASFWRNIRLCSQHDL